MDSPSAQSHRTQPDVPPDHITRDDLHFPTRFHPALTPLLEAINSFLFTLLDGLACLHSRRRKPLEEDPLPGPFTS
ncbi:hypothetical protein M413DRAFT_449745 [Hebeloma cylindrosporum]|uniref:Uncharacterized protein n=1 Tax=Hebeloma cylindrosporum TaxID=76867 RepID=A0A0C3BTN1_HEBCY|nr:hypothetical protein M413DRAFT_449745 [Hebeloma cylindrosporum h7]